jgi:cation transport ATPase
VSRTTGEPTRTDGPYWVLLIGCCYFLTGALVQLADMLGWIHLPERPHAHEWSLLVLPVMFVVFGSLGLVSAIRVSARSGTLRVALAVIAALAVFMVVSVWMWHARAT